MSEQDYVGILIESLEKKKEVLRAIQKQNEIQDSILSADEFDADAFDKTIDDKEAFIGKLTFLDNGFNSIYERVKVEINDKKEIYKTQILKLKELIEQVTELGAAVEASERRNDLKFKNRFKGEHQKVRQSKASVKAVSGYYKNMSMSGAQGSVYMDQKK